MNPQLSPLQIKLLEMLRWFDGFCRENQLRYYAVGGTLLGAVRHGGFIPWDDDIDLAMPRKDYEKLQSLMGDKRLDNYLLESPKTADDSFCYPFCKLYDTTTTLIEHKRKPLKRGVFLDIFPLDGVGNDLEEGKRRLRRILKQYYFYISLIGGIRKGRSVFKNAVVLAARIIPKRIVNPTQVRIKLDRMCAQDDFDRSLWVGNLLGAWGERELVSRTIIGVPVGYPFENMTVMGVERYDEYLTNIYGDWRQLPPKEKQVTHHDFISMDLTRSYMEC